MSKLTNLSFEENQTYYSSDSETLYIRMPPPIFERVNLTKAEDFAANNTVLDSALQNFSVRMTTSAHEEMENNHRFTMNITTPTFEEMEDIFLNSTTTTPVSATIAVTEQSNIISEIVNNFTTPKIENDAKKKESDYMFYCIAIMPLIIVFLFYLCFLMLYIRRRYHHRNNSQSVQGMLPISA